MVSHHHAAFFLDQMPQHLHPLPGDQVAVDIRIIKEGPWPDTARLRL